MPQQIITAAQARCMHVHNPCSSIAQQQTSPRWPLPVAAPSIEGLFQHFLEASSSQESSANAQFAAGPPHGTQM